MIKRMFKRALLSILAGALLIPAGTAMAKTKYVVGVQNFAEYLPYSNFDKQNKSYTGFNREILDMFAKSQGYTFVYRGLPIKRLYKEFLNGRVDLKYPDNKYWTADLKRERILNTASRWFVILMVYWFSRNTKVPVWIV